MCDIDINCSDDSIVVTIVCIFVSQICPQIMYWPILILCLFCLVHIPLVVFSDICSISVSSISLSRCFPFLLVCWLQFSCFMLQK